ncbi:DNA glycosylase [Gymnopilus junonius]|uniref:Adenine DNA glycosylase n=1 Tax=Gymnopilus junonius TaxID=109634 RepID=A0A9P5NPQ7_GYMJU|nr:DNA glycosylase [Gymnopilus junonius]
MAKRRRSQSLDSGSWSNEGIVASPSDSEFDDASFELKSKHFPSKKKNKATARKKPKHDVSAHGDEDERGYAAVPLHAKSTHAISFPQAVRSALLSWYQTVRDIRGMPWRQPYDPNLGPEERAQRAYEVWISEIMLQQTQVTTVIPYYNRWMQRFPTIRDLAGATIDEVNSLWKGLGYYSRASRLLAGAQKAVKDHDGRLPDNAKDMEANIPGIGRYSAGAICSIAYGEKVPVLDGNVHRLLSRFLALHAPPKAKPTLDILWAAAQTMVEIEARHPGDINQALIELGSTVCKVRQPNCQECPLRTRCAAYQQSKGVDEQSLDTLMDIEDACHLCESVPAPVEVTSFPMKANRKKKWHSKCSAKDRYFLMTRRPENGLLAGLYDFPTSVDVSTTITHHEQESLSSKILSNLVSGFSPAPTFHNSHESGDVKVGGTSITKIQPVGDVLHIFSHIRKTYKVLWVVLEGGSKPPGILESFSIQEPARKKAMNGKGTIDIKPQTDQDVVIWVPLDKVMETNIGTGVVKVWNLTKKLWEKSKAG